jgi:glycosyltransferase involved in cell wall biosynthesis
MIEALATGTPVVATPLGAAPEIVDDGVTGFLRTGRLALAAALLEAGGLDRSACRAVVRRRFDSDRMVQAHLRFYESLPPRLTPRRATSGSTPSSSGDTAAVAF